MNSKDIRSGECQSCGRTGYWCRCGEHVVRHSVPMTDAEIAAVVASVR